MSEKLRVSRGCAIALAGTGVYTRAAGFSPAHPSPVQENHGLNVFPSGHPSLRHCPHDTGRCQGDRMTDRSSFGPTPGPGFAPAPVTGPFSGPPGAARVLSLALGCPDLFLIDATAGPDRDGFAAALAATAARLGRTVLVVSPDGAVADMLLSHLSVD